MSSIAWIGGKGYKKRFYKNTKAERILCVECYCGDQCDLNRECTLVANEAKDWILKAKPLWKAWD